MKIAILSDIHENFHNLVLALKRIDQEKCEKIVFLGDFMNKGIAQILARAKMPVLAIWGNNDGEKVAITKISLEPKSSMCISGGMYDFLEIEGRKIFISHYPDIAKPMAKSGEYDAVFYGHNHIQNEERVGNCLLVNPGEISAHKTGKSTFAIYDTQKNSVEFALLKDSISLVTEEAKKYLKEINFEFNKDKGHQFG